MIPHSNIESYFRLCAAMLVLLFLFACGSDDNAPVDGDADQEVQKEEESTLCDEDVLACLGTQAVICRDGDWLVLADCADAEKVCEKGECVNPPDPPADGDTDLDDDPVEQEPAVDTTPPEIESTSPVDGAQGVDPGIRRVIIVFSEAMELDGFVMKRDLRFFGGPGNVIYSGQFTQDKRQLDLSFGELEEGVTYTISIEANSLHDLAGNAFAGTTFYFTVAGELDGDWEVDWGDYTAPTLRDSLPRDGQSGVSTTLDGVLIYFSEAMDRDRWDIAAHVSIKGDDDHEPLWEGNWLAQPPDTSIFLSLNEALHINTTYQVSIDAGITDMAGNAFAGGSISFDTWLLPDGDLDLIEIEPEPEWADVVEEEHEQVILNTAYLDDYYNSNCNEPPASYDPANYPESVEANYQNNRLTIVHHNAPLDSCLQNVSIRLNQDGALLELFETVHNPVPCDTPCPIDVTTELTRLMNGLYTVRVWPDGASEALETQVQVP